MNDEPTHIQRFDGVPRKTGRRGERTFWKNFMAFFSDKFQRSDELAVDYATAYVNEKQAEAQIKANEAAKIAEETALLKSKNTEAVFSLIDNALGKTDPGVATELKVRQLLENNPHLEDQIRRIHERGQQLSQKYGTRIDVRAESDHVPPGDVARLLPPQDEVA